MLEIKEEFKKLIPALTAEEFKQLEANCLRDGILSPICLWNGFIIDGHNRYEISLRHQLKFESVKFDFETEEDVKNWMIEKQLGQRNLTQGQKDYLIGKRYENEKQKQGTRNDLTLDQNDLMLSTAQKIAKEIGIGEAQVKRNEQFAQGVDKMSDELKQQVLQGNSNINKADIQLIAKAEHTFIANTDKEIIEKAKEIKEQKAEAYKQKIVERIETKVKENPISIEEIGVYDRLKTNQILNSIKTTSINEMNECKLSMGVIDVSNKVLKIETNQNYVDDSQFDLFEETEFSKVKSLENKSYSAKVKKDIRVKFPTNETMQGFRDLSYNEFHFFVGIEKNGNIPEYYNGFAYNKMIVGNMRNHRSTFIGLCLFKG